MMFVLRLHQLQATNISGIAFIKLYTCNRNNDMNYVDRTDDFAVGTPQNLCLNISDEEGIIENLVFDVYIRDLSTYKLCSLSTALKLTKDTECLKFLQGELLFSIDTVTTFDGSLENRILTFIPLGASLARLQVMENRTEIPLACCGPIDPTYSLQLEMTTNHYKAVVTFKILDLFGKTTTHIFNVADVLTGKCRLLKFGNSEIIVTNRRGNSEVFVGKFNWTSLLRCPSPVSTLLAPTTAQNTNPNRAKLRSLLLNLDESQPLMHSQLTRILQGLEPFQQSHPLTTAENLCRTLTLESLRTHHNDPLSHLLFCFDTLLPESGTEIPFHSCVSLVHNALLPGALELTTAQISDLLILILGESKSVTKAEFVRNVCTYPILQLLNFQDVTEYEAILIKSSILEDIIHSCGVRRADIEALERIGEALGKPKMTQDEMKAVLPKYVRNPEGMSRVVAFYQEAEIDLYEFVTQWVLCYGGEKWSYVDRFKFLSRHPVARASVINFVKLICRRGFSTTRESPLEMKFEAAVRSRQLFEMMHLLQNTEILEALSSLWSHHTVLGSSEPVATLAEIPPNTQTKQIQTIEVTISHLNTTANVNVPKSMTIRQLKKEIQKKFQIPVGDQILMNATKSGAGNITQDGFGDTTVLGELASLNICPSFILRNARETITLKIRAGQSKKVVKITVPISCTVLQLKHDIHQALNIPLSKMHLSYGETSFLDRHTLSHYHLADGVQISAFDGVPPT